MARTTPITIITVNDGDNSYVGVVRGVVSQEQRQKLAEQSPGKRYYYRETVLAPSLSKLPEFKNVLDPATEFKPTEVVPLPDNI